MMNALVSLSFLLLSSNTLSLWASEPLSEDQLRSLSAEGQRYLNEEIKRALFVVKQMKEVMVKEEDKHKQLIQSLKHSYDKKQGAERLAQESERKLQEGERACRLKLVPTWAGCQPCLQAPCKALYTPTCQTGASLSLQVEEFFRRMASQLEQSPEQDMLHNQDPSSLGQIQNLTKNNTDHTGPDQAQIHNQTLTDIGSGPTGLEQDLAWVETSFRHVQTKVNVLYTQSLALVVAMQQELGQTFHAAFTTDLQPGPPILAAHAQAGDPLGGIDLSDTLGSFVELGHGLKEVGSALTNIFEEGEGSREEGLRQRGWGWLPVLPSPGRPWCRHLRRRAAGCRLQRGQCESCRDTLLTECPTVPERYSELGEITLLLNASHRQYRDILQALQMHTQHTLRWAEACAEKHAWVTRISNGSATPPVFSLAKVVPGGVSEAGGSKPATLVVVSVLGSPLLSVSVPAELELTDPAFIQLITHEALLAYKHTLPPFALRADGDDQ